MNCYTVFRGAVYNGISCEPKGMVLQGPRTVPFVKPSKEKTTLLDAELVLKEGPFGPFWALLPGEADYLLVRFLAYEEPLDTKAWVVKAWSVNEFEVLVMLEEGESYAGWTNKGGRLCPSQNP